MKINLKKIAPAVLAAVLSLTVQVNNGFAAEQTVTKNGTNPSVMINSKNFVGEVRTENLFSPHKEDGSNVYAANVTFSPNARTNWHIHSSGQSLIVLSGVGYVQEWGKEAVKIQPDDVVWCPPGVKHWHGATRMNAMTHTAISESNDKGVEWLEPVSDEEYPVD